MLVTGEEDGAVSKSAFAGIFAIWADGFDGTPEEIDKISDYVDRAEGAEESYEGILDVGQDLSEIDLVAVFFVDGLLVYEILGGMGNGGGKIEGEDACVEILIDGVDAFSGPVFHLNATLHGFVVFFNSPAFLVEVREGRERETTRIKQGGHENFRGSVGTIDAKETNGEWLSGETQLATFGMRRWCGGNRNHLFLFAGAVELRYGLPGLDGNACAEMGLCGSNRREEPKCGIPAIKEDEIVRLEVGAVV